MIPIVVARQMQRGLVDYIDATFPFANEPFKSSFQAFTENDRNLFLEPYASIKLPFRVAETMPSCFQAVKPKFMPYRHQAQAYERLARDDARSTLIATGTGSGKTECFEHPILDYCYRHRAEPGIKALIIYPMNALASDQALRLAGDIYGNDKLKGNVSVGLFVGGFDKQGGSTVMTQTSVITNRETMIENPPDILLTNYKMLDLLLIRPGSAGIWSKNGKETLKYVAVDELHTFDGAQGTDLACLLRRLKDRLGTPKNHLSCIGTSATMGDKESCADILKYATEVFGEPFDTESVITEDRLSADEFFSGHECLNTRIPSPEEAQELERLALANDAEGYLALAARTLLPDYEQVNINDEAVRKRMARDLMESAFLQGVLEKAQGRFFKASALAEELTPRFVSLADLPNPAIAIEALVALVSHARNPHNRPFLNVTSQLWIKELARFVASVGSAPVTFDLAINLTDDPHKHYLPLVSCRECGQTAWTGLITSESFLRVSSLDQFYRVFFETGTDLVAARPRIPKIEDQGLLESYSGWVCPECLKFYPDANPPKDEHECKECSTSCIPVYLGELNHIGSKGNLQYKCPYCGSRHGLSLVGLRGTSEAEVVLTQLFSSAFDEDDKTLVFSDNVQDASHRASFFNGRTWRFGLRGALTQYLLDKGEGKSLDSFAPTFVDYWRARLSREKFVSRFIAPNNLWMNAYEAMIATGRLPESGSEVASLFDSIEKRMRYEVLLEIGLRSQVGRTLEKSGVAAIEYNPDTVQRAAVALLETLENKFSLQEVTLKQATTMVVLFADIMRRNGAFANQEFFDKFVREGAKSFFLSHKFKKFLPGMHASGLPTFLLQNTKNYPNFATLSPNSPFAAIATRVAPKETWGTSPLEVVRCIKDACYWTGLLKAIAPESNYASWGLSERELALSPHTVRLSCDICGTKIVRAAANAATWEGAPCLSDPCRGHYHADETQGPDYYGRLFKRGLFERVVASEHTGLLARPEREDVERHFKATGEETQPWYPNVLSCTPTLEMGIDIGDLSSLILCGMPPGQAQFLQRVGRAGRRDGNAFSLVIADASPHGMYFFGDPTEMMEGNVEAPHIFLCAAAVLERQFIAYGFDRWIVENGTQVVIPDKMSTVLNVINADPPNPTQFPFNYLYFVRDHSAELLDSFLAMYSENFSPTSDTARELRAFVNGSDESGNSPLYVKVYNAFKERLDLRCSYREQKKELEAAIKKLKELPKDPSFEEKIAEAENEEKGIRAVIGSINDESVEAFLSRESLLPNYAFPEEGVSLRTILRRRANPDSGGGKPRTTKITQEYSRAAASAISEFAPGNMFYAGGRHFEIDQIDLTTAKVQTWRLCPNCPHGEQVYPGTPTSTCPKCGSPGWADTAQLRKMIKLSTVVSNGDYEETLADDASDKRVSRFFSKQTLVDVDEARDVIRAYEVHGPKLDFGFDYVRKAVIREINYGETASDAPQQTSRIAGDERARSGFRVCTKCGTVQRKERSSGRPIRNHTYACPEKDKPQSEAQIENCLFLYREFITEAFRILVPEVNLIGDEGDTETFVALVRLGLQKKFGNVDHLSMTVSDEPDAKFGIRKRYLVIYDTVPGGTGYLKQLASDEKAFLDVLRLSKDALESCSCTQDPTKDGCYHCLFAYRQSRNISNISHKRALEILEALLNPENEITEVKSLGDVQISSLLESELEVRFVERLGRLIGSDGRKVTKTRELVNGKLGWRLDLGDVIWEIEPQVHLGPADSVAIDSKPDFVFRPIADEGDTSSRLPIAVFTDGFAFHKDRIADDTAKRMAVIRSGKYRVWSLSWDDVVRENQDSDHFLKPFGITELPTESAYNQVIDSMGRNVSYEGTTPFGLFAKYLTLPTAEATFKNQAEAYALGMLNPDPKSAEPQKALETIETVSNGLGDPLDTDELLFKGLWRPKDAEHLQIAAAVTSKDIRESHCTVVDAVLDDTDVEDAEFQKTWNGFLHLINGMQFTSAFAAVTKRGLDEDLYQSLSILEEIAPRLTMDTAWEETFKDLFTQEDQDFASRLAALGIDAPDEVGYELESGEICEMAWLGKTVCYIPDEDNDTKNAFKSAGWTLIEPRLKDEEIMEVLHT